jgi:hypothetical protein
MVVNLDTPILGGGIRNTHYFQGRLLSAEDLATDQLADRDHRAQLGRAIGPGVVHGLEARIETAGPDPVIAIEAGLAIDALGQTVALPARALLALTSRNNTALHAAEAGLFGPCDNGSVEVDLSGDGVYVLLLSPASGFRERTPKSGLEANGVAPGCGARYAVEGAQFRLAAVPLANRSEIAAEFSAIAALDDPSSTATPEEARRIVARFRNALAHLCLRDASAAGQAAALRQGQSPALDAPASILAELASSGDPQITPCDVPIAMFYIDLFGLRFVDRWAARRLARSRIGPGVLSLLPEHGLERLLQFLEQLDDIVAEAPQAQLVRVEDYFRYLPPAGWFPAAGGGVAGGFSPSQFLGAFTDGVVGRMATGTLADLLERSFRHRPIDLTATPCLQLFDLDENTAALAGGAASQRLRVFLDRAMNAPAARDGLALALERCWQVYRGLARRIQTYGAPHDDATRRAAEASAIDVADIANRYAAVALAWRLDPDGAFGTMSGLRDAQLAVADRLEAISFTGTGLDVILNGFRAQALSVFVDGLRRRLDVTIPATGALALGPAIAARDLCATVAAQDAINDFVGEFGGEGGASGPSELRWVSSPQGQIIVPGAAVEQVYEIMNGTNRRLSFALEATANAPNGTWTGSTAIRNPAGVTITQLPINSGASGRFHVAVTAPDDAMLGDAVSLDVRAFVAPPNNRELVAETLTLTVGEKQGDPIERSVRVPAVLPPQIERAVSPGGQLIYQFNVVYQAESGPNAAEFDVSLTFTGPVKGWLVAIMDASATIEPVDRRYVARLSLKSGDTTQVQVFIRAPKNSGATNGFSFAVASVGLDPEISQSRPETFTIATT